ncbi:hypothetical protein [Rhodococcus sp. NPDC003348]
MADVAALRALAASLRADADTVVGLDPSGSCADAAAAMPDSAVGAVLARAADPILAGYRRTADRMRTMAATADDTAAGYEAADGALRDRLSGTGP